MIQIIKGGVINGRDNDEEEIRWRAQSGLPHGLDEPVLAAGDGPPPPPRLLAGGWAITAITGDWATAAPAPWTTGCCGPCPPKMIFTGLSDKAVALG